MGRLIMAIQFIDTTGFSEEQVEKITQWLESASQLAYEEGKRASEKKTAEPKSTPVHPKTVPPKDWEDPNKDHPKWVRPQISPRWGYDPSKPQMGSVFVDPRIKYTTMNHADLSGTNQHELTPNKNDINKFDLTPHQSNRVKLNCAVLHPPGYECDYNERFSH